MKLLGISTGLLLLFGMAASSQEFSAFPELPPRNWGGVGFGYPDVSISLPVYPRFFPILVRPQADFGIFQPHGHALRGGKLTIAYLSPFSSLGIGNMYIGAIGGYDTDRLNDRISVGDRRVVEEERIFLWGGVLGEWIEVYRNVYLSAEIRFLNQEVERRAIDPPAFYETSKFQRTLTTWMVGVNVLLW